MYSTDQVRPSRVVASVRMPNLDVVIKDICAGCAKAGHEITEVLAAFIARTIIEGNPAEFSPTRELTNEGVNDLVGRSIRRLLERDSPSLETVKMQVGFDSCYVTLEEGLSKRRQGREQSTREMATNIVSVLPRSGADFDTLTNLYRMIFAYLLAHFDGAKDISKKLVGRGAPGAQDGGGGGKRLSLDPDLNAEGGGGEASSNNKEKDRNMEREVAAALESVFPRIGLKAFVMLSPEQKRSQLAEMANLVLGIRLFNREMGKGGAGLEHFEEEAFQAVMDLKELIEVEIVDVDDLCLHYQETLVYVHLSQPQSVSEAMASRWAEELSNRRQYLSYLHSLQEDVNASLSRVTVLHEAYLGAVAELQHLVGSKKAVPKDQVYPKFEGCAKVWLRLVEEARVVHARQKALAFLHERNTAGYHGTLAGDSAIALAAKEAARGGKGYGVYGPDGSLANPHLLGASAGGVGGGGGGAEGGGGRDGGGGGAGGPGGGGGGAGGVGDGTQAVAHTQGGAGSSSSSGGGCGGGDFHEGDGLGRGGSSPGGGSGMKGGMGGGGDSGFQKLPPLGFSGPGSSGGGGGSSSGSGGGGGGSGGWSSVQDPPVLLTMESTPEFLQLPLEYQGFCPWTVVARSGLLLPGRPNELGLVRYAGRFFVFAHQAALEAFMDDPEGMRKGVVQLAKTSAPELIHLLRLQDEVPEASIKGLIAQDGRRKELERIGAAAKAAKNSALLDRYSGDGRAPYDGEDSALVPGKRDAGTTTPTHFVEKRIDVNYEWNEWALRRRALQTTNIRKCVTTGQQTDQSHFRRENDSQVYLPKVKVTQTRLDKGTHAPQVTQYVQGLLGTPAGPQPSKYALHKTSKPGMLHLVLEPGAAKGHEVIGCNGGKSLIF